MCCVFLQKYKKHLSLFSTFQGVKVILGNSYSKEWPIVEDKFNSQTLQRIRNFTFQLNVGNAIEENTPQRESENDEMDPLALTCVECL